MSKKEILTIANVISFIRFLLAGPIYYYISIGENTIALLLIIIAIMSDGLDGYFARKWNQITSFGKIIDPLADKACTIAGFIALSLYMGLPIWITIVIIVRDVIILLASLIIIGRNKIIMASNKPGKIAVFILSVLGVIYLLNIEILKLPFIILAGISIIYSIINYTIVFYKNIVSANEE
jgi:CDP-diacylglycerol--glycerol-3-phosphate 3-phosphatidyltransferase